MSKLKNPINFNDEYHRRSLDEAMAHQREVEGASLEDRKEARKEFAQALEDPPLIGERVSWLIDGNYGFGEMRDPRGPESGNMRIVRGGSWVNPASRLRCATRYQMEPFARYADLGFRCAASPEAGSHAK